MAETHPRFYYAARAVLWADAAAMFGEKTAKQIAQCEEYVTKHLPPMLDRVTETYNSWMATHNRGLGDIQSS